MWSLDWLSLFFIITLQNSLAASDLYVQPGRNVTIPCLLNIPKSNVGSLYWQKINNSTQGFETLYSFIKFANGLGWQSPLRGYVANFTDLVLLNVTFSHDGVYNCRISTHNAPQIIDRKTYLHVILPLLDIEIRKSEAGTVLNNGEIIQVLHGEVTDVECAVVGNVSPVVELQWLTSENHNQTFVSTSLPNGPSSSVKLNGSLITHEENITCRAVQWITGRPYLTIESTFILKRLLPLLEIEVRKSKAGTVINNGETIQLLHGEETDVECAVVGNVSSPVELRWITSEDHNQTFASTSMPHGPSSSAKLNGSRVTHEENITCRAVQWIAGRPYLTIESTFILKRLHPRIDILNCTAQVDSQPDDCCLIDVSSNLSTNSVFVSNLTCEAKNTVSPVNLTWFHQLGNQSKEIETTVGYAISAVPDPGDIESKWTCSLKDHEGETWNMSACLYTNSPPGRYKNFHPHALTIAAPLIFLVMLLAIIFIIVFIFRRKKGKKEDNDTTMENSEQNMTMVDQHAGQSESEDEIYQYPGPPSIDGREVKLPRLPDRNVRGANATSALIDSDAVDDNSNSTPLSSDYSDIVADDSILTPSQRVYSNTVYINSNPTPISSDESDKDGPSPFGETIHYGPSPFGETIHFDDNSNSTPIPSDESDTDGPSPFGETIYFYLPSNPSPLSSDEFYTVDDNSNPTPHPHDESDTGSGGDGVPNGLSEEPDGDGAPGFVLRIANNFDELSDGSQARIGNQQCCLRDQKT